MAAVVDQTPTPRVRVPQPRNRSVAAGVVGVFVALSAAGVAFSPGPVAGGATASRRPTAATRAASRAAHVPIDAALVSRARIQAEQKVVAELVRQQQAQAAAVAEYYRPKTSVNWDGIARCETGGNWSMQGRSFSGGVGFYNGTWNGFGGQQFAPNAGMATREQQIVVAERVHARYGLSGWGCRAYG